MPACAAPSRAIEFLAGCLMPAFPGTAAGPSPSAINLHRKFRGPVPIFSDQPRRLDLNVWPVGGILRLATWAALVIACAASLALRQADTRYEFGLMPKDIA